MQREDVVWSGDSWIHKLCGRSRRSARIGTSWPWEPLFICCRDSSVVSLAIRILLLLNSLFWWIVGHGLTVDVCLVADGGW